MDSIQKTIVKYDDVVREFIDIYYDGFVSRKVDSKVMPLKYSITMLKKMFYENNLILGDKYYFLSRCNEMIISDKKFKRIGTLSLKGKHIVSKREN